MGLTQDKLIFLALFLGSDYTMGIKGVGIVNAMEIVEAFDSIDGLRRFRDWALQADILLENAEEHYKNIPERELKYKQLHKNYKKHWEMPETFPSERVIDGYKKPLVDKSLEKFSWGKPNFELIRTYCMSHFEWDKGRTDELIVPLEEAIAARAKQPKITDFFRMQDPVAKINSKRIINAVANLRGEG